MEGPRGRRASKSLGNPPEKPMISLPAVFVVVGCPVPSTMVECGTEGIAEEGSAHAQ